MWGGVGVGRGGGEGGGGWGEGVGEGGSFRALVLNKKNTPQ